VNFIGDPQGGGRPKIILSANTAWFLANFCSGLIRALREAGYEPIALAPRDPIAERSFRELEVQHFPVAVDRSGINPLSDLRLFGRYWTLIRKVRPAAYLGFTIKPNIYGSLAAASAGVVALPTVTGLGTTFIRKNGPLHALVARLYRAAFRQRPLVFFLNNEDADLFVGRRIVRRTQAHVLPGLGIDLDHFAPAPPAENSLTFLLVGRLLRDKGVGEFVEAGRRLQRRFPNARFQLLGPVDEGNRTAILASELQSWVEEGVIEYLGEADDVRPLIAQASVVVLPSYREGMPRSLLEAAAMGRPLIATDVAGCRDIVEDGANGYLCEVRDAGSLADTMQRMAELAPRQRQMMGERARKKVEEEFSEELVVRAYVDALKQLVSA